MEYNSQRKPTESRVRNELEEESELHINQDLDVNLRIEENTVNLPSTITTSAMQSCLGSENTVQSVKERPGGRFSPLSQSSFVHDMSMSASEPEDTKVGIFILIDDDDDKETIEERRPPLDARLSLMKNLFSHLHRRIIRRLTSF